MQKEIIKNEGFVLLFAVVLSSIILSITVGVANIALKEVKFGTSARDTNYAFFAADTGVECALFNDKTPSAFPVDGPATNIDCATTATTFDSASGTYRFAITGLGNDGVNCAKVSIQKDDTTDPPNVKTKIISKGYNVGDNVCDSSSIDRIEREIEVNY